MYFSLVHKKIQYLYPVFLRIVSMIINVFFTLGELSIIQSTYLHCTYSTAGSGLSLTKAKKNTTSTTSHSIC